MRRTPVWLGQRRASAGLAMAEELVVAGLLQQEGRNARHCAEGRRKKETVAVGRAASFEKKEKKKRKRTDEPSREKKKKR